VHQFVDECAKAAPPGAVNAALVAEAQYEHYVSLDVRLRERYVTDARAAKARTEAAEASVCHPDFKKAPGWVWALNTFGFVCCVASELRQALTYLDAADGRLTAPFTLFAKPKDRLTRMRRLCEVVR
jgi:hypothetical protein